ncbi:MAG: diacylglycerol kinase family protein [Kiritimatiellia bacterium]
MRSNPRDMSIGRVLRSVGYALAGVRVLMETQHSAHIHALATLLVAGLAAVLRLPIADWCWLTLAIAMVWFAETINTAVEFLCDVVSPGFSPMIKNVKDVAAAAVFFAITGAVIIGFLILGPPLLAWWKER